MSHSHSHAGHSHGHAHSHAPPTSFHAAFAIGIGLNLAFVAVEAAFGVYAQSLALLADAGHNLSDVLGLLLAWGALWLSRRQPTETRTYGLRRSSIMAALLNATLLLVAIGGISWEAIQRLQHPEPSAAGIVMWVAGVGILINGATALLFLKGQNDLNIRGAFLHMAADAGVSLGVVLAAITMAYTGWLWLDPAISLAIAVIIFVGTWGLLRESIDLALDAVPKGIDPLAVEGYLTQLPGVTEVHDLHIWAISTTETALTAHLIMPDTALEDALLKEATDALHDRFGIEHTTLQIERGSGDYPCGTPCRAPPR